MLRRTMIISVIMVIECSSQPEPLLLEAPGLVAHRLPCFRRSGLEPWRVLCQNSTPLSWNARSRS
jgi:hypothetical protein